ncbi:UTP--glucose-1-phosphate uridylyltransferase [Marinithermofilum abyssi]|uniref:UTP--glucose-1-phosphate uridylyltransferase n=1 Tax=Marinithermofilum abyssi TaxID=1571185 RepID=A0A8J2VIF2_9BACL|nr:UTP--glucose-1-phosphate uridylyltransferase GalU [Marinithermofilum abyssi]GGE23080.1 UTP--glucose-1-phosphate uridylyltransferase [Marinithermofilum abyssi]
MRVKKAVIPAAGMGTRFLPATKALPKEMLPIIAKPAIQFIVEEAVTSGIQEILIITGRGKQAIENHFDKSFELEMLLERREKQEELKKVRSISRLAHIHYIRQREPEGLGDAVLQARSFVGDDPFALLLGDDIVEHEPNDWPCTLQLAEQYEQLGDPVIGVQTVNPEEVSRYGVVRSVRETIQPGELLPILDVVEKPRWEEAPSRIAMMGRYILDSRIFRYLERIPRGLQGEFQLTDALRELNRNHSLWAYGFQGTRHDVGNPLGFLRANLSFALNDPTLEPHVRLMMAEILANNRLPQRSDRL